MELLNSFAGNSELTRSAPCRRCEPYTWAGRHVISVNEHDGSLSVSPSLHGNEEIPLKTLSMSGEDVPDKGLLRSSDRSIQKATM